MSSSQDSGLMSNAGLVRYFEEDDSYFKLDPKTVTSIGVVFGLAVIGIRAIIGM